MIRNKTFDLINVRMGMTYSAAAAPPPITGLPTLMKDRMEQSVPSMLPSIRQLLSSTSILLTLHVIFQSISSCSQRPILLQSNLCPKVTEVFLIGGSINLDRLHQLHL